MPMEVQSLSLAPTFHAEMAELADAREGAPVEVRVLLSAPSLRASLTVHGPGAEAFGCSFDKGA